MKHPVIPIKAALTVGLAVFGLTVGSAAFAQQVGPTLVVPQGVLQQPTVTAPIYTPYFDVITDTPPATSVSPGYFPPGPRPEVQTITMQHRGPIIPEGPLVEWEDSADLVYYGDPMQLSANVLGTGMTTSVQTTTPGVQAGVTTDLGTGVTTTPGVQTGLTTQTGVTTDVQTGMPLYYDIHTGAAVTTPMTYSNIVVGGQPGYVDHTTGSLIMTEAVRGVDGTVGTFVPRHCPAHVVETRRGGFFSRLFGGDREEVVVTPTADQVMYTQAVRGTTTGGCGYVIPQTSQPGTLMFDQGVRGTESYDVYIVPGRVDSDVQIEGGVRGVDPDTYLHLQTEPDSTMW